MDEGEARDKRSSAAASEAGAPAIGPQMVMWELSLERLKLLDYETKYTNNSKSKRLLHKLSFIAPGANPSHQLDDFVNISSWLCAEITNDADFFRKDQYDDPNAVVNKLLLALRKLDFKSTFQPSKLKLAYGEAVCTVLDFLTEKALQAKRIEWSMPIYPEADKAEALDDSAEDLEEEEVMDEAGAAEGSNNAQDGGSHEYFETGRGDNGGDVSVDELSSHQILEARVDPVAWKTELERVGPKLRAAQTLSTNEWRSHVDQTVTSRLLIDKILGETKGDLAGVGRDAGEELNKVRMKEKYINHQFSSLSSLFAAQKKVLEGLQAQSGVTTEKVAKLTSEAAALSDALEEIKESFESKDSGAHDTSPLVRVKAALQQLKSEIQALDLRIGVVSHSLLSARADSNTRSRLVSARSNRRRLQQQSSRSRDHGNGGDGDDSLSDYDDDT